MTFRATALGTTHLMGMQIPLVLLCGSGVVINAGGVAKVLWTLSSAFTV
jgi:hypothetical protein